MSHLLQSNRLLIVAVITALASMAGLRLALAGMPVKCDDVKNARSAAIADHMQWITLSHDQWEFLRGVYAINPWMPEGLPMGDTAVLVTKGGRVTGTIVYVDTKRQRACNPMAAPAELLDLLDDVVRGTIPHERSD